MRTFALAAAASMLLAPSALSLAPAQAAPAPFAPTVGIVRAVAATGTVTTNGTSLTVRSTPSTSGKVVKSLANGTRVSIICQTAGTTVNGHFGTSNIWDMIAPGQYISDTYVKTGSDGYVAPKCGSTPPPSTGGYKIINNYPYKNAAPNGVVDKWNFYARQCTSWAAWAVNDRLHIPFHNHYKGQHWGNANHWDDAARAAGFPVSTTPKAGNVAVSNYGTWGHVAFVARVNADGSYVVEEYNAAGTRNYQTRTIARGASTFQYFITMK